MRGHTVLLVSLLALAGCSTSDRERAETLTQRQRDSIVAESKLPGARAVGSALRAADAAADRAAALDSITR